MAIYLTTGTPGAGKTLWTLWTVENRRKSDNAAYLKSCRIAGKPDAEALIREVYYFNIHIKNLPWIKLEKVEDWHDCPVGSIIVFDECQQAFPPRGTGSKTPEYVQLLAKHRHKGFDLYFITQHPSFVDSYVRKLPEFHNHLMRPFGAKMATVHSFKGVRDNVDKSRKDSITSKFSYPKEVFTWYKSAELHTHKFSMPLKIWMLFLIPFIFAALAWGTWRYFDKKIAPPTTQTLAVFKKNDLPLQNVSTRPNLNYQFDVASFKPRIDDLPWSAPRYDDLTKPTLAPQIMGCMVMKGTCKCMTQQGTYHIATMKFCLATIENGIFQDFGVSGGVAAASGYPSSTFERADSTQQVSPKRSSAASAVPVVTATTSIATRTDSGFNLPIAQPSQRYAPTYETFPSGAIAHKRLPPSSVLFNGS